MIPAYGQNQGIQQWNPGVYPGGTWGVNPAPLQQAQPPGIDGTAFVQGENAALAFVVPAGKTYLLIDTVEDRIYFKSADIYGRPSPLNDFWLTKEKPAPAPAQEEPEPVPAPEWAKKSDLDDLRAQVEALAAKKSPGRPRKEETEDE